MLQATHHWGLDIAGTLTATGGVGALVRTSVHAGADAGKTYHYGHDANGNVTVVLDTNGTLAAAYEYSPYGELLRKEGPRAASNPWRFSSKYADDETGLVYYGLRYYSPRIGRFINQDPIGESGGLNLYAFVRNSPVNAIDILGLSCGWQVVGYQEYSYEMDKPNYMPFGTAPRPIMGWVCDGQILATVSVDPNGQVYLFATGGVQPDSNGRLPNATLTDLGNINKVSSGAGAGGSYTGGDGGGGSSSGGSSSGGSSSSGGGNPPAPPQPPPQKPPCPVNAAKTGPSVGDTRISSAKIVVSNVLFGEPGTFDKAKAAVIDFARAASNPASPLSWTSGVPRVDNIYKIVEHIEALANFTPSAASTLSGGYAGATSWYMNQASNMRDILPPLEAWTSIQIQVYAKDTILFGLISLGESWHDQGKPINTRVDAGSLNGYYGDRDMAVKAATEALKQQLNAMKGDCP